jgi:hypothetical protein
MTIQDIIDALEAKPGERTDRIKEAIDVMTKKGLFFVNGRGALEIRKYAEKTGQVDTRLPQGEQEVGTRLSTGSQQVVKPDIDNKGVITQNGTPDTEEEEEQKKNQKKKEVSLDPNDQISFHLAKLHNQYCPAQGIDLSRKHFLSALNTGLKITEQDILNRKGILCWDVIKELQLTKGIKPKKKSEYANIEREVK